MNKIKINQGRLIDSLVRTVITIGVVVAIGFLMNAYNNEVGFVIALVLSFSLFVIWTAFRLLEIDLDKHEIRTSRIIMSRSFGVHVRTFGELVGVEVSMSAEHNSFQAYLVLDKNEKVFLISDEYKEDLLKRLRPILKKLKTEIISS